jgi:hypothetical protein
VGGGEVSEEWRDVVGYEGIYKVSNRGSVKTTQRVVTRRNGAKQNIQGGILKGCVTRFGYILYGLTKDIVTGCKGVFGHRIVAEAFIENNNNYPIINHMDGNKLNNNVENLEWCTYSQNNQHAVDNKLRASPQGERVGTSKLKSADVINITECISDGFSLSAIARFYGVAQPTIRSIAIGRTWGHVTGIPKPEIYELLNNKI